MKAILELEIDLPENCKMCIFCYKRNYVDNYVCAVQKKILDETKVNWYRDDNCPLRIIEDKGVENA